MSKLSFWIKNARSIALPQSVLPCLTAIILCIGQDGFLWWLSFPIFFGICAAHLGMNLADDYFDYKHDSRTRADISSTSVRARMEKCHYLGEGKATISQLGWAVVGFLFFAALMGAIAFIAQWLIHGWQAAMGIVLYAVLGLIVGINYSGKPLELGFHGFGELVIGLMFGPLCMLGIQAAMTGIMFSWPMFCMSVAIGSMVTNIVYVHSVMEVNADAELGKMTYARLLQKIASYFKRSDLQQSDLSSSSDDGCCGEHLVCERETLLQTNAKVEYYDDEEEEDDEDEGAEAPEESHDAVVVVARLPFCFAGVVLKLFLLADEVVEFVGRGELHDDEVSCGAVYFLVFEDVAYVARLDVHL